MGVRGEEIAGLKLGPLSPGHLEVIIKECLETRNLTGQNNDVLKVWTLLVWYKSKLYKSTNNFWANE